MDAGTITRGEPVKAARPQQDISYILAGTLAVLIWSTSFVATKMAYRSFPPLTLGAARFVIASLVLGTILLAQGASRKPTPRDAGLISVSGVLGITVYFALENTGVRLTTASNAALIIASYPAITSLFELLLYRTRVSWMKMLGISMALFGVYRLSHSQQGGGGEQQLMGNLLLIAAGIVWTLYNFVTRRVVRGYPMITVSFYQTVAGTLTFIPLALTERASWQVPTIEASLILLYLGVFCSVAAFLLYNYGLRGLSELRRYPDEPRTRIRGPVLGTAPP